MPIFATNCHISIGSYIEEQNVYASKKTEIEEAKEVIEDVVSNIPSELNTEQAWKLWDIAIEKGWLNKDLQLMPEMTKEQAAIIAERMGYKLGLKFRWKPFERLWDISYLQSKFDRGVANENLRDFYDAAYQAFK